MSDPARRNYLPTALGAALCLSAAAPAAIINVPGDEPTIQAGIDAAVSGDEVVVANGTYTGLGNKDLDFGGKLITVRSASGDPTLCIIDCNGSGQGFFFHSGETAAAVVDGFTITDGNIIDGGAINIFQSDPTVQNCIFLANTSVNGGGMVIDNSNAQVANCTFIGNTADFGGGMFVFNSNPTVFSCVFSGNTASTGDGGGVYGLSNGSFLFLYCTFSGNTAAVGTGGAIFDDSSFFAAGCIVWGNTPDEIQAFGTPTVLFCDVQGGWAGSGNIDLDPMFCDADGADGIVGTADDNLRLFGCSPAIDAGFNIVIPITTDADGNPRFVDDAGVSDCAQVPGSCGVAPIVDMGAYERQVDSLGTTVAVPGDAPTIQEAIDGVCQGGEVVLDPGTYSGAGNINVSFRGKAITVRSTDPLDPAVVAATVVDCQNLGRAFIFNSGESDQAVLDGLTVRNGENHFGNCCGAVVLSNFAEPTISNCVFEDCVAVGSTSYGGAIGSLASAGNSTIVDCTFTGNTADLGGAIDIESYFLTIKGCTFSDNLGDFGGAIIGLDSGAYLERCVFTGNTATGDGGAIDLIDTPAELFNCLFVNNAAEGDPVLSGGASPFGGGAVAVFSTDCWVVNLTNCTLVDNHMNGTDPTDGGGGVMVYGGGGCPLVDITNCILRGNTGGSGTIEQAQVYELNGPSVDVSYSNLEGLDAYASGAGNIDADPRFVDEAGGNLRLDRYSPCVDSGWNFPVPITVTTDLDGLDRFVDDTGVSDTGFPPNDSPYVDMGAYERQSMSGPIQFTIGPGDSIQATIDEAVSNDEIIVNPGTYFEAVDFGSKPITLRSAQGADVTIIDATGLNSSVVTCASAIILDGFTLTGGSAPAGGGMVNGGNSKVSNCIFRGNTAVDGGGMFNAGIPYVTNCVFEGNTATNRGGAIYNGGATILTHCSLFGNQAGISGGGVYNSTFNSELLNSIVWGNVPDQFDGIGNVITYSDIQGGHAGAGNIDADPMFAGADGWPGPCSPVVDAGNNNTAPVVVTIDLDGNPRYVDDTGVADTGLGTPPLADMGAYERQVSSFPGGTAFVPAGFPTIQTAIDAACDRGEIVVAPGTYMETIDFKGKPLTVRSSGGPAVTTIDGNGAIHVVRCADGEGPDTVLDGFTITGGDANGSGGDGRGGGMFVSASSPTIVNCVFDGNQATERGGGLYVNNSASSVTDCVFLGNQTNSRGGGLSVSASTSTVANCVFSGNSAGFQGGAVWATSDPTIVNCSFSSNNSPNGGGMYSQSGVPAVINCVFRGNTVNTFEGTMTAAYSNVEGGWSGTGNIDADPLFVDADGPDDVPGNADDDLRLLPPSPCVDTGDNASVPAGITTDLDGNDRILDGDNDLTATVDMGAYELVPVACPWDCDGSGDGAVNVSDLLAVLAQYDPDAPSSCTGGSCDYDGSGCVDVGDLLKVLAHYDPAGVGCP